MEISLLSLLNHSENDNIHKCLTHSHRATIQLSRSSNPIKYLLINRNRILWHAFSLVHFDSICRQILAREDIAIDDVKNDSVQLDVTANIKILPRVEVSTAFRDLASTHELSLCQSAILRNKLKRQSIAT